MLNKKEFVRKLALKGYTIKDAEIITEDVLMTIMEIMAEGDGVHFVGFGTFYTAHRKGSKIVDPQGNERMRDDYDLPVFKSASSLRRAVVEGFVRK